MSKSKKAVVKSEVSNVAQEAVVVPVLTHDVLRSALDIANSEYIKRRGSDKLDKDGLQSDIKEALKIVSRMTDSQLQAIEALDVAERLIAGVKDVSNVKVTKRVLQVLLFSVTGSGKFLKSSAQTFLIQYCGILVAAPKTRDAMRYLATGKGNEHTSDEVKTSKAIALRKAFGVVKQGSEQAQYSVGFADRGIARILDVAKKDSRTGIPNVINAESKITYALNAILEKLTDSQIALIVAQSKERNS